MVNHMTDKQSERKAGKRFLDLNNTRQFHILIKRQKNLLGSAYKKAEKNSDHERLVEIDTKRRLLVNYESAFSRRVKSIFISNTGNASYMLDTAKAICTEYGFEVRTGFDKEVREGPVLPQEIMTRIRSSSVFLGIWTQDFDAQSRSGTAGDGARVPVETGGIPGVWMPFELGVAASLGKPFKILFEEGTHRLYYEKPFSSSPHFPFNPGNFRERLTSAIGSLNKRYEEIIAEVENRPATQSI